MFQAIFCSSSEA